MSAPAAVTDDLISLIDMTAKPIRVVSDSHRRADAGSREDVPGRQPCGRDRQRPVRTSRHASPFFNDFGLLKIYKISGTDLTPVTEAKIGHWCQGMVWSKDSKYVVAQCMVENELIAFSFLQQSAEQDIHAQDAGEPRGHPHRGTIKSARGAAMLRRLPYSVRIGVSFRPLLS